MFEFLPEFNSLENEYVSIKLIEKNYGNSEMLPFYYFDIYNKQDKFVGKISIRIGNNYNSYYNGHIGYEIFSEFQGFSYSLYASKLVIEIAKAHAMGNIYITCNKTNVASKKIIAKLGAVEKETVKIPEDCFFYKEGIEDYTIFYLDISNT